MIIQLMKNNSPFNQVTKNLTNVTEYDVALKNNTEVLRPAIIVTGNVTGYNYAYIPDFGRYYFLGEPITRNESTVEIDLTVDPLMSFAGEIRANGGVVERNANQFQRYYNDNLPTFAYKVVSTKAFSKAFNNEKKAVLVACGGK